MGQRLYGLAHAFRQVPVDQPIVQDPRPQLRRRTAARMPVNPRPGRAAEDTARRSGRPIVRLAPLGCRVCPIHRFPAALLLTAMSKAILTAALVSFGLLPLAPGAFCQSKDSPMNTAAGTFDLKMLPPSPGAAPNDGFVRVSIDKTYHGSLQGAARVEMMATGDGTSSSGGYVALERFTGTLDGAAGTFILQHSGVMAPG